MSARTHLAAVLAGSSFEAVEDGGGGWIDLRMRTTVGPATLSWTGSSAVLAFPCVWCEDLTGNVRSGNRPAMRLEDPRYSMADDLSPEAEAVRLISFLSACLHRKNLAQLIPRCRFVHNVRIDFVPDQQDTDRSFWP